MTRRLAALVVAAGLSAGLVAGCGIPDHTAVEVEDVGPLSGSNLQHDVVKVPEGRLDATSVRELVANFLAAAAGEFDDGGNASKRIADYVAPGATGDVSLAEGVTVVKVETDGIDVAANNRDVTVRATPLGLLNPRGEITAPSEIRDQPVTYKLQVAADRDGRGWHLTKLPATPTPLLDVQALADYYRERPIYFWNTAGTALVPDLRWLPLEVGTSRVPTELLKMMAIGPSDTLSGVARPLPLNSKLLINAPFDNVQVTMNWSPDAIKDDGADRLAQQVAWTLRGLDSPRPQKLVLKINGQLQRTYADLGGLLNRTPYPIGPEAHAYAILDGTVRALGNPVGTPGAIPLAGAADQNLKWAALNRSDSSFDAAIVTNSGSSKGVLQVGTAPPNGPVSTVVPVRDIEPTSPPVWLPRSRFGLVTTAKGLYQFRATGRPAPLAVDDIVKGAITAVATSPDGQRIALIAGGDLWVVPVVASQDGLTLTQPRQLPPPLGDLAAVGWSGETALSVAGTDADGKRSIVDVTVDGARRNTRILDGRGPIEMIAAYPESTPLTHSSAVLYEADNLTWLARGGFSTQMGRSSLDGEPATASPSPDQQTQPKSPFFVY
ncbi:MAG TPA: LpqB family beta-propeller domain-containing protein [Asanoa sp.]|jgi:hypothetical protein|nr:LpqB family beta-propeller domain-containing protein [Asanoa sp.]